MTLERKLFRVHVGLASWPCIASCADHARRQFTAKGYENPRAVYVRTLGSSIGATLQRIELAEPPVADFPAPAQDNPESFGQKLLSL